MPCPFYHYSHRGNPLEVCGTNTGLELVPSLAHLKLFCLSISAHRECPTYKRKRWNGKTDNRWSRFLKHYVWFLTGQSK